LLLGHLLLFGFQFLGFLLLELGFSGKLGSCLFLLLEDFLLFCSFLLDLLLRNFLSLSSCFGSSFLLALAHLSLTLLFEGSCIFFGLSILFFLQLGSGISLLFHSNFRFFSRFDSSFSLFLCFDLGFLGSFRFC